MIDKIRLELIFYRLAVIATVIILLWVGAYKFTEFEAKAILPLVENHPLMSWLYKVLPEQAVSNLIGVAEIIVGLGLLFALRMPRIGLYTGLGSCVIFVTTLSFLLTTPGACKTVEGFPVCNFFILKDLGYLAISALVAIRGMR